ncbi:DNA cytosine methyltransferase [Desulfovibrio cuneatus]|uniref:DNA cytosine methyltransferase n=1 Tax=Desulfovibrio cuneatus TaxID=159728 RepID=UPI0003FD9CD0|nr:DNA cytosine methyltransferase [Desulfovibrio cuneatus]
MPKAYYNEIDPHAAAWLRELIKAGHIAPGEVDERSIEDVVPTDLAGYTQCHFFAGIGVWSYALRQAGWPDSRAVWTGSCPCQPFSAAGKGAGFADERHLWPAFFHLISQCKPSTVFGEQVGSKDGLAWLDLVHSDLEGTGYTCGSSNTPAAGFGAPHIRQRLYFCATNPHQKRLPGARQPGFYKQTQETPAWSELSRIHATQSWGTWVSESGLGALIDGAAARVVRLRGYGNAIVAPQAQAFI